MDSDRVAGARKSERGFKQLGFQTPAPNLLVEKDLP